jgi:hypothetical protein
MRALGFKLKIVNYGGVIGDGWCKVADVQLLEKSGGKSGEWINRPKSI